MNHTRYGVRMESRWGLRSYSRFHNGGFHVPYNVFTKEGILCCVFQFYSMAIVDLFDKGTYSLPHPAEYATGYDGNTMKGIIIYSLITKPHHKDIIFVSYQSCREGCVLPGCESAGPNMLGELNVMSVRQMNMHE